MKQLNPDHVAAIRAHVNNCPYFNLISMKIDTLEMGRSILDYLRPAASGRFIARGKSIKTGKTICLSEATVFDDKEKMLAHGTATLMVLDTLEINAESKLPPKYLIP